MTSLVFYIESSHSGRDFFCGYRDSLLMIDVDQISCWDMKIFQKGALCTPGLLWHQILPPTNQDDYILALAVVCTCFKFGSNPSKISNVVCNVHLETANVALLWSQMADFGRFCFVFFFQPWTTSWAASWPIWTNGLVLHARVPLNLSHTARERPPGHLCSTPRKRSRALKPIGKKKFKNGFINITSLLECLSTPAKNKHVLPEIKILQFILFEFQTQRT